MMMRRIFHPLKKCSNLRALSSIITEIHPENDEIAVLKMNAPPINALSSNLLKELEESIQTLEQNEDIRGMILTSAKPGIFSAGLNLFELYNNDEESLVKFWTQVQDTWFTLYKSPLATVAAI